MFNSFPFDYVARQKIQGNHLTWYSWNNCPSYLGTASPAISALKLLPTSSEATCCRLTYSANDMKPFAIDQGYEGPPYRRDAEDRLRRRARLDALFFLLYGLTREEADYVLGTFPSCVNRKRRSTAGGSARAI